MSQCKSFILYGKLWTSGYAPAAKAKRKVSSVAFWIQ